MYYINDTQQSKFLTVYLLKVRSSMTPSAVLYLYRGGSVPILHKSYSLELKIWDLVEAYNISDVLSQLYKPSKFSMDNAWTSKPTCANMTLEIPTSNKHRTSRWKNQFCVHVNSRIYMQRTLNFVGSFITRYNSFWFSYRVHSWYYSICRKNGLYPNV